MINNELQEECIDRPTFAQRLVFLAIGGGIGAALALLFAPKSGRELREDIAKAAGEKLDQASIAASRLKEQTAVYYANAKETGSEVLEIVASGISAIGEEVKTDASKIGHILAEKRLDEDKAQPVH